MRDSLHIVCPNCEAVNRVPSGRLHEQPTCGKCSHALFSGKPIELNSAAFAKQVARSDVPVLVDFWAPWCGPCRTMAPAYEQVAARLEPEFRVVKVNTEEARDVAAAYNIRSIPTLALVASGREVARQAGAMDAPRIIAWAQAQARSVAQS